MRYNEIQVIGDRIEYKGTTVGLITAPVGTARAAFEEEMLGSYAAGLSQGYDNAISDAKLAFGSKKDALFKREKKSCLGVTQ